MAKGKIRTEGPTLPSGRAAREMDGGRLALQAHLAQLWERWMAPLPPRLILSLTHSLPLTLPPFCLPGAAVHLLKAVDEMKQHFISNLALT